VRVLQHGHAGVVSVIFADVEAAQPYYVMPYFPGGSLSAYAGKLSAAQLRNVAAEIAGTIAALHGTGTSHGDIKPDNTLVTHEGRLRVGDPLGNGPGCTILFSENCGGTPGYMAPEIRQGTPISPSGDIYSYGATLLHLATGRRPREGERPDLLTHQSAIVPDVRAIIVACCNPLAAKRPGISDVLRMLRGESWQGIQRARENMKNMFLLGGAALAFGALVALASE